MGELVAGYGRRASSPSRQIPMMAPCQDKVAAAGKLPREIRVSMGIVSCSCASVLFDLIDAAVATNALSEHSIPV